MEDKTIIKPLMPGTIFEEAKPHLAPPVNTLESSFAIPIWAGYGVDGSRVGSVGIIGNGTDGFYNLTSTERKAKREAKKNDKDNQVDDDGAPVDWNPDGTPKTNSSSKDSGSWIADFGKSLLGMGKDFAENKLKQSANKNNSGSNGYDGSQPPPDNRILGMPPAVAVIIGLVLVGGFGYMIYSVAKSPAPAVK